MTDVLPSTGTSVTASTWQHRPARGYSWPAFTAGHTISVKSGTNSERFVAPRTELIYEALIDEHPWLAPFGASVSALARVEALITLYVEWLDRAGEPATIRGMHKSDLLAWEGRAQKLRASLGLDPVSALGLGYVKALTDGERAQSVPPKVEPGEEVEAALRRIAAHRERLVTAGLIVNPTLSEATDAQLEAELRRRSDLVDVAVVAEDDAGDRDDLDSDEAWVEGTGAH